MLQTKTPKTEFNKAILRPVKIQTEPHTMRVNIKNKRRPSGSISIFSCFLNTFINGNIGEKLRITDIIVPTVENISDKSNIKFNKIYII